MSFRRFLLDYMIRNGLFPNQADVIFSLMTELPSAASMQGRWEADVEAYPDTMKHVVRRMCDIAVIKWMDEHLPDHGAREVFNTGSTPPL